jgi:mitogen-activated protein kinase 1/3
MADKTHASKSQSRAVKDKSKDLHFSLGDNYEIGERLGAGAYGTVIKATHKSTKQPVAIKRVEFQHHTLVSLRALRELKLLKYFAEEGCTSANVSHLLQQLLILRLWRFWT